MGSAAVTHDELFGADLTIGEIFGNTDANTMIHLTASGPESFANGIDVGTYFARLGDVSDMTVDEYQVNVVGPFAQGYGPRANLFVTVGPGSGAFAFDGVSNGAIAEYLTTKMLNPTSFLRVP